MLYGLDWNRCANAGLNLRSAELCSIIGKISLSKMSLCMVSLIETAAKFLINFERKSACIKYSKTSH